MKHLFILLCISTSSLLFSQDKKVENPWSGNFDLGLNFTKNNESTFQFNNIFLINYKSDVYQISLANNIAFVNKTGEDELLNKGVQDFKYTLDAKKLDANIMLQHLYDISRSVKNRYTTGIGVSYNFTNEDNKKIAIGLSALREKEIPLEGEDKLQNRLSSNFDFLIKLNKNIAISTINHYQPNIKQMGDFRWKTNISFRVNLSPHFLLNINSIFNYDSVPAEGIPETDYQLINSISYTF